MRLFPSEKQFDTMELRGVKVSIGTESAGTAHVLPLSLTKPLAGVAARLVLLTSAHSATHGALRGLHF